MLKCKSCRHIFEDVNVTTCVCPKCGRTNIEVVKTTADKEAKQ